jgi:hypothetical protein
MAAKRTATPRKPAGILLRYRDQDTAYGVTRKTTARLAKTLGLSETQVVHVALANLARQTLPRYEPDDGPLTRQQLAAIDKLVRRTPAVEAPVLRRPCATSPAGAGRHRLLPLPGRGLPGPAPKPARRW